MFAIEETLRENTEILPSTVLSDNEVEKPKTMPSVEPFMNTDTNLTGNYKGIIVTYDWSGSQIIKEEALNVSFAKAGNEYHGVWMQGNDTLAVKTNDATGLSKEEICNL